MARTPKKRTRKTTPKRARGKAPKGRRKARRQAPARRRRWPARLLALSFLFALVAGVYLLYLDYQVKSRFEGRRWAVPARVYGRPMELYPGAAISVTQLTAELRRLGYRKARSAKQVASWSRDRERVVVRTRPFRFWDGPEPGRLLDLRFKGANLERLLDARGRPVALARLEPPEIGSIFPTHNEDRVPVAREALPALLVQGLLAVEDRDFYRHHGVSPKAILRAGWANLRAGGVVQGGSTLTQQLVKNLYLTRERSLGRKLNEAVMALILDARYSKEEILGAYANEIYLGQDGNRAIHGFGLASQFYFNRPLGELDLPRIALLVGLIKGPSYYNPRRHPERAKRRRNLVLQSMREQGVIDEASLRRARSAALGVVKRGAGGSGGGRYPAFLRLVRRQLQRDYREQDLTSEGLRIFTTLDPWVQGQVEEALSGRLRRLEKQHRIDAGTLQGAMVVTAAEGGEVLALAGGRNPRFDGFNRALDAVRPIGSLIKPVVYLAALMQPDRYSLITLLQDAPVDLKLPNGQRWRPENYSKRSHGEVPLHQALAHSYNLATVRLGLDLGVDRVLELLRRLGVSRPVPAVPAVLLGSVSLSPLEVAQLYQTFADGGFYTPLRAIREVLSAAGEPLQRYPLSVHQAVPPGPVYLLDRNLQEVVRSGTGRGLSRYLDSGLALAGKTGTTDNLRDSWFAGFSGDRVAVAWVGRDDNRPAGLTGAQGALQVWGDAMKRLRPAPLGLSRPDGVETVWIDPESGLRADQRCPGARQFPFIAGYAPVTESSCVATADGPIRNLFRSFFE